MRSTRTLNSIGSDQTCCGLHAFNKDTHFYWFGSDMLWSPCVQQGQSLLLIRIRHAVVSMRSTRTLTYIGSDHICCGLHAFNKDTNFYWFGSDMLWSPCVQQGQSLLLIRIRHAVVSMRSTRTLTYIGSDQTCCGLHAFNKDTHFYWFGSDMLWSPCVQQGHSLLLVRIRHAVVSMRSTRTLTSLGSDQTCCGLHAFNKDTTTSQFNIIEPAYNWMTHGCDFR